MLDKQATEWLKKHANDLPSEEVVLEEIKIKKSMEWLASDGIWPVPHIVDDIGIFENIHEVSVFNEVIGNPDNWDEILKNEKLYNSWVLPVAILLFSKPWFDKSKRKDSIRIGIPFPLFSREERKFASDNGISIDETPAGRAIIARIISKTSYALKVFLRGNWHNSEDIVKNPGGYIIGAIKNDLVQKIGADLGLKQHSLLVCPYCLSFNERRNKSLLIEHGSNVYGCERCESRVKHLILESQQEELNIVSKFQKFIGTTCICPSNDCSGKFIPVDFMKVSEEKLKEALKTFANVKGTNIFKMPPEELMDVEIDCPYCKTNFTPRTAMELGSGFKCKSGMFTGLPKTLIWETVESVILDKHNTINSVTATTSYKDRLVSEHVEPGNDMIMREKVNLLIDDLTVKMTKLNKNIISGMTTWYFYKAAIEWMNKYYEDAYKYFFNWEAYEREMTKLEQEKYPGQTRKKMTDVVRGQEVAIHQSFFHVWLNVVEENINDFNRINPDIKDIKDLKWFCHFPKFPGPVSTFVSEVDSKKCIVNNTDFVAAIKPRLVRIYSICKEGEDKNYIEDIERCNWQSIKLRKDSELAIGDKVTIEALMMPGHPTHAPIQRILRLRSLILHSFVVRIKKEEKSGNIDSAFWNVRKKQAEKAIELINSEKL